MGKFLLKSHLAGKAGDNFAHLVGRERVIPDLIQLAIDPQQRMLAHLKMNVRRLVLYPDGEKLIERFLVH
jgi:hypothetical protein